MKKNLIILIVLTLIGNFIFADTKGDEIARKNFELKKANDTYSVATMTLIDKKGNKKQRKLEMYAKETPQGENSFIKFLEPADVYGTSFLTIAYKNGDDDQRLYLPALKSPRKIASSEKNQKFVGSDLTYYDMQDRDYEDFTYQYLKDETVNGKDCYVIEIKAKDPKAPYSKSIAWIGKEDYVMYKTDCYDAKNNELIKTIVMVEVKNFNGIMIPTKTVVDNIKENHKTLLQMDNVKINTGLKDSIFTIQNLVK